MTIPLLQIATAVVALVAAIVLLFKRRIGSILLVAVIATVAVLVRPGEWTVVCPFFLVYIALLLGFPKLSLIVHGCAGVATAVLALTVEGQVTDWKKLGIDRFSTSNVVGAYDAFNHALEFDPDDLEALEWRAIAGWNLQLQRKALVDITRATEVAYKNFIQADDAWRAKPDDLDLRQKQAVTVNFYTRFLRSRCAWMAALGEEDQAIHELDAAQEHGHLKGHGTLVLGSAELRVNWCDAIQSDLTRRLEEVHPDRVQIREMIDSHLRSANSDNPTRDRLIFPLTSQALRDEVDSKLGIAWRVLREADEMIGEIRAKGDGFILPTRKLRAQIDTKLGRLLRAKEELQGILQLALQPYERAQVLLYLAEVLRGTGCHYERALRLKEVKQIFGGDSAALAFKADYYEALFDAANSQPDFRPLYLKETDEHLGKKGFEGRRYEEIDMRSLGYRGVAALRFESDPAKALKCLRAVYDALRVAKGKDPSILQPRRAKLFVETMLEAALKSPNPADRADGVGFANVLLEVSKNDSDLRQRRAALLEAEGLFAEAAEDLKVALRNSKLDHGLFDRWIEVSSKVKDSAGNTPSAIALAVALSVTEKMAKLREELAAQDNFQRTHKLRQSPKNTQSAFAKIFDTQAAMAADPLIAWHMSAEFGRMGRMADARDFLFKAVTAEPEILPFKLRLGELRLDLGLYAEAARDFQAILERDPDNVEVVQLAYEALTLAGDLAGARKLRRRAIDISPQTAGVELGVRSHLENGNQARALELLGPRLGTPDPRIELLSALSRLADGKYEAATKSLRAVIGVMPDSADVQRALLIALANLGDEAAVLEQAQRFVKLPRLLPVGDVLALLDRLTAAKQYKAVGFIANEIYSRYSEAAAHELWMRGVLGEFKAGNLTPLRQLVDDPSSTTSMSDTLVHAAFGVALREKGAFAAARFLQAAREYTDSRDEATLLTAAAFSLTPHVADVSTFLSRFEHRYTESRIPLEEVALWWCTRQRASAAGVAPDFEPGVETELSILKDQFAVTKIGDEPALDVYLRFHLYRFAGDGFESDARKEADKLLAVEPRLMSAARCGAEQLEASDGNAVAAPVRKPHNKTVPNHQPAFRHQAPQVAAYHPAGTVLFELAKAARKLFPEQRDPVYSLLVATLRKQDFALAASEIDNLLTADPKDVTALRIAVDLAHASKDPAHVDSALTRIIASQLADPALLEFLVEYTSSPEVSAGTAIQTIGPVYQLHPEFYRGARRLAEALAESGQKTALVDLAKLLIARIPGDPLAAPYGDDLSAIIAATATAGERSTALALADVALDVDPVHPQLRRQRFDLLRQQNGDQAALGELEVLCTMAPRDSQFLFAYADLLLQERGDKLDLVTQLLPYMRQLAPEDPRYFEQLSKIYFLRPRYVAPTDSKTSAKDQINQALLQTRVQLVEALKRAPGRKDYWYRAGVIAYLIDDPQNAKLAFDRLDKDYKLWPRVEFLLTQMAPTPKP